ncbi:MAG: tetratricopeptide repeat protein [Porphyrobacter sp.]|nr:tetratricopeptide repeat protein [Porphyrobacter sp.]
MATQAPSLAQINALAQQGQLGLALSQIEQVVIADSRNAQAWHLAGMLRRKAGDNAGAVDALDRAIALGQGKAEVWNSLGLAHEDSGDLAKAETAFAKAATIDRSYTPGLTNHARMLGRLGRHAEGEAVLAEALRRNPKSPDLLNALGALLIEDGRADEAEGLYRQSLAMRGNSRVAVIRLGQTLREQGRADEAVALYRTQRSVLGETPEFVNALAGALVENGEWAAAEAELERLCAAVPGNFQAHRSLARLAREYGTGKDCYRSFRQLAAQFPDEPAVWLEWIGLLLHYRDYAEALEVIAAASACLSLEQLDYAKAVALSETGEGAAAEALFHRLETTATGMQQAGLTSRARNAIRLQDPALAERLCEEAVRQDPLDQFALAYLGLAWRMRGDARELWLHDYERQAQQVPLEYLLDPARMEELRAYLRTLHKAKGHPPDQSLRHGTQTEGALLSRPHPLMRELRGAIAQAVRDYIDRLPDDAEHPYYRRKQQLFRFAGSWSVRLTTAGFHVAHIHQEGWISSALHLVVPARGADEDADAGALVLGEPPAELQTGLPPRRVVTPREGWLTLFPSSMWHGTLPFSGGSERMTVAFDIAPI